MIGKETVEDKVRRLVNGNTRESIVCWFPEADREEAVRHYDKLEQLYGDANIPVEYPRSRIEVPDLFTERWQHWKGITGPGKLLREMIKAVNDKNRGQADA